MPDSNRYRLLRSGTIRTPGARTRRGGRTGRYGEQTGVSAPNLEDYGHQPFLADDVERLSSQLQDRRWPRGTLNICGLEGLLTALLVLPLGLRPGVWLPLIWNEAGWKAPAIIQDEQRFHGFVEMVIGFMRLIDRGYGETPLRPTHTLDRAPRTLHSETRSPYGDWARGFAAACRTSTQRSFMSDLRVRQALTVIAECAQPVSTVEEAAHVANLVPAVFALASLRTSRGAFGLHS